MSTKWQLQPRVAATTTAPERAGIVPDFAMHSRSECWATSRRSLLAYTHLASRWRCHRPIRDLRHSPGEYMAMGATGPRAVCTRLASTWQPSRRMAMRAAAGRVAGGAAAWRRPGKWQQSRLRHTPGMVTTLRSAARSAAGPRAARDLPGLRRRGAADLRVVPARVRQPARVARGDAARARRRPARSLAPARVVCAVQRDGPQGPPRPQVRGRATAGRSRSARRSRPAGGRLARAATSSSRSPSTPLDAASVATTRRS